MIQPAGKRYNDDLILVRERPPEPWMIQAPEIHLELNLLALPEPRPGWQRVGDLPEIELRRIVEAVFLDCDAAVGCCGALANPLIVDEAVEQLRATVGLWRVPESEVSE